jgi:hypothetical protein
MRQTVSQLKIHSMFSKITDFFSSLKEPPRPLIYFHHIGKTAGTSVSQWLETGYPKSAIFTASAVDQRIVNEDLTKYRLFRGHFPWAFGELLPPGRKVIVFLRDPVAVLLSGFNHLKRLECAHIGLSHRPGSPIDSLDDFLADDVLRRRCTNFQLRSIASPTSPQRLLELASEITHVDMNNPKSPSADAQLELLYGNPSWIPSEIDLDLAKSRLSTSIVGIAEDMNSSILAILRATKLTLPAEIPHLNCASSASSKHNSVSVGDLTDAQLATILEMTKLDRKLYKYGLDVLAGMTTSE